MCWFRYLFLTLFASSIFLQGHSDLIEKVPIITHKVTPLVLSPCSPLSSPPLLHIHSLFHDIRSKGPRVQFGIHHIHKV